MRDTFHARSAAAVTIPLAIVLAGCGGLERVAEPDVDVAQKATAQRLGTKIYEACVSGQHESLGDDAIPEMRDALAPDKQQQTCAAVTGMFGTYQSMDYAETWKLRSLRIYRFKGHFSKGGAAPEIRVVMDSSNKLSGFWLKPWTETPQ